MILRAVSKVTRRLRGARALVFSAALAGTLAGCGGDAADPADDFVGTWSYVDFSSIQSCDGHDPTNQPPQANKTFARGLDDDSIVDLSPSPLLGNVFCNFTFGVNGPVATVRRGPPCQLTSLDSLTVDSSKPDDAASPLLWSFTLNSPTTAEELVTATVHYSIEGVNSTCRWAFTGHLQRVSKD
ncbi:MAG TPA: hypothetical protein VHK47_14030 [Polyangia bacterium]|jgi:hypothetical protein|nr:hypothetical protein [Polyangia bacterium]